MSVLLLLALVDESLLLHIPLGDKNLLWYTAVFSAALAVSRSLIPEPEDAMFDPEGAMRVVRVCSLLCGKGALRLPCRCRVRRLLVTK